MIRCVFALLLFGFYLPQACAQPPRSSSSPPSIQVDLFMSSTCPHCHKASEFFDALQKQIPWLVVHKHVINLDKSALTLFAARLKDIGSNNFAVPAMFFCKQYWVGFDTDKTTGKKLTAALQRCFR